MAKLMESVASIETKNGKWRAKLIGANIKGSSAYYPAEAVEAGAPLFKSGTQMFANHLSQDEQWNRPEGDVNNLIGVLESDAVFEEDGLYADLKIFAHKKDWLKEVAPYIGLSIRANGIVKEGEDGFPILEQFTEVLSVDVVTRAGADGKFVSLAESAKPGVLTEAQVEPPKEEDTLEFPKELAEALDAQAKDVKAMTESLGKLLPVMEALVEAQKPAEKKEASATEVAEALVEAKLTKTSRARVLASVEGGAELAEAIKAEQDLQAEILEEAEKASEISGNLQESGKSEFDFASVFNR